eukprot:TRINITY_DN2507_c0_g2_i1.p1 TRINITY_DN2507_c0_g2~~TRINITY_DN2507_c0_g2_i1.p1  ORF type:complete len:286 (-),score=52.59 TRINITY_DN2507_c0_g2_i1:31-888(-)
MGCVSAKEARDADAGLHGPPKARKEQQQQELSPAQQQELEQRSRALKNVLASASRDYLVDASGKKVPVESLARMQAIGLLFSAHGVPIAREFTRLLADVYTELRSKGKQSFEVVFLSNDDNEPLFKQSLGTMPWLAVPFSDTEVCDKLGSLYEISEIPTLVVIDAEGRKITSRGVELVQTLGVKAWPFTRQRGEAAPNDLSRKDAKIQGEANAQRNGQTMVEEGEEEEEESSSTDLRASGSTSVSSHGRDVSPLSRTKGAGGSVPTETWSPRSSNQVVPAREAFA